MLRTTKLPPLIALFFLGACTTMPDSPSVLVLPGTGKNFDQFRADDFECKQFASSQLGGASNASVAADSGVRSAAVGTILGAAAGAAINGRSGAGVGAGTGLAMGGLAGTGAAETSARGAQRRYDMGYQQCMYAKGHRVPVSGHLLMQQPQQPYAGHPPPPSGNPPPPPPGVAPPPR
jgi:hypothetical protein